MKFLGWKIPRKKPKRENKKDFVYLGFLPNGNLICWGREQNGPGFEQAKRYGVEIKKYVEYRGEE